MHYATNTPVKRSDAASDLRYDTQKSRPVTIVLYEDWQWMSEACDIRCKWEPFREQILMQWPLLTTRELDQMGPNRHRLAQLICHRYGVTSSLIENYLQNFERTLPL